MIKNTIFLSLVAVFVGVGLTVSGSQPEKKQEVAAQVEAKQREVERLTAEEESAVARTLRLPTELAGRIGPMAEESPRYVLWQTLNLRTDPNSYVFSIKVAFSPKGKALVVGSQDGSLSLWNITDRHPGLITTLRAAQGGHVAAISSVAFNSNGRMLASGSVDGAVKLWDITVREPRLITTLGTRGSGPVYSVAFSPDNNTLVSGTYGAVSLWNITDRQPGLITTLIAVPGEVRSVAFSPDGNTLIAGALGAVGLWNVTDGPPKLMRVVRVDPSNTVAFSPRGKMLIATWSAYEQVRLLDITDHTPTVITTLGTTAEVISVAFSPDGKTLAAGHSNRTVSLWDITDRPPTLITTLRTDAAVDSVAFSSDGETLAVGYSDGTVKLWQKEKIITDTLVQVQLRESILAHLRLGSSFTDTTLLGLEKRYPHLYRVAENNALKQFKIERERILTLLQKEKRSDEEEKELKNLSELNPTAYDQAFEKWLGKQERIAFQKGELED